MQTQRNNNFININTLSDYFIPFRSDSFQNTLRKYSNTKKKTKLQHKQFSHHHYQNCRQNISKQQRLKLFKQSRQRQKQRSRQNVRNFRKNIKITPKQKFLRSPMETFLITREHNHQCCLKKIQIQSNIPLYTNSNQQAKQNAIEQWHDPIIEIQQEVSEIMKQLENVPQNSTQSYLASQPIQIETEIMSENVSLRTQKKIYRISLRLIDRLHKKYCNIQELLQAILILKPHLKEIRKELKQNFLKYFSCKQQLSRVQTQ